MKTMFKVIENLLASPDDEKVRRLPKTNKAVQAKILAHNAAVKFLETAGFDFSDLETARLIAYDKDKL